MNYATFRTRNKPYLSYILFRLTQPYSYYNSILLIICIMSVLVGLVLGRVLVETSGGRCMHNTAGYNST